MSHFETTRVEKTLGVNITFTTAFKKKEKKKNMYMTVLSYSVEIDPVTSVQLHMAMIRHEDVRYST